MNNTTDVLDILAGVTTTAAPFTKYWRDCDIVYPPLDDIITALQDQGKKSTIKSRRKKGWVKY